MIATIKKYNKIFYIYIDDMGNGQNLRLIPHKEKKVLIVGISYAGFQTASKLWDYFQVTVID